MSFIDNVCLSLGLQEGMPYSFRVVMLGEVGVLVEGVKGIISFAPNEIILKVFQGKLSIKGESLKIKKYFSGDFVALGKIFSVNKND